MTPIQNTNNTPAVRGLHPADGWRNTHIRPGIREKKKAKTNKAEMSSIRISPTGSNDSSSVTALLKSEITWSHELRNYGIHNFKKILGYLRYLSIYAECNLALLHGELTFQSGH
jgi:hypothetical protein